MGLRERRPEIKRYRYTGDDGRLYEYHGAEHLAEAGGLVEIQRGDRTQFLSMRYLNPRYVWAKETVPSKPGSTKRVKIVVEPDSPLYKTAGPMPVTISGIMYVTTGRVGESLTWGATADDVDRFVARGAKQNSAGET